jgi:hypothetical protein
MTEQEWAAWEAGDGVAWAWRRDVAAACEVAIALRRRLDRALADLELARHRAEALLADTDLACDIVERKVRLGPWPRTT